MNSNILYRAFVASQDITNPSATSMDLVMIGEMQNTGPFHADISFPGIVTVSWNNIELGTTVIPGSSSAA